MGVVRAIFVYRVEHRESMRGPCYNERGLFDPVVLKSGLPAVDIPMPFNQSYVENGRNWYAAGETIEDMKEWFNKSNIACLNEQGFVLRRFELRSNNDIGLSENHLKFDRDCVHAVVELDIMKLNC